MAKQTIDIGSGELAGDGEELRTAFQKINSNFDELYITPGVTGPTGPQGPAWTGGRLVPAPTTSIGSVGDLQGDFAFSTGYFYYCFSNYTGSEIWKRVSWNNETW